MCHYHSIISIALNLNNDWSHVSIAYVQAKALKNRFDFCMQIVLSQQKCPVPLISEELAQSLMDER